MSPNSVWPPVVSLYVSEIAVCSTSTKSQLLDTTHTWPPWYIRLETQKKLWSGHGKATWSAYAGWARKATTSAGRARDHRRITNKARIIITPQISKNLT